MQLYPQLLNVGGPFASILSFLSQTISIKLLKLSYATFLISKLFDSPTPNATFIATALPYRSLSKKDGDEGNEEQEDGG